MPIWLGAEEIRRAHSSVWRREDGPERNSGVFPQETEPEAGRGGAGEPEHLEA